MKSYDPKAICPACQHDVINSLWMPERVLPGYFNEWAIVPTYIERKCDRCHFTWPEEPLDKEMFQQRLKGRFRCECMRAPQDNPEQNRKEEDQSTRF